MDAIVQVEGLRKTYGTNIAVDGISFEVQAGEIFGLVGPNGAGKTTTIECLEGLRQRDSGVVTVLGVDPQVDGKVLRTRAGMQLQQSNLPDRIKVWEVLDLYASFYTHTLDWKQLLLQLGLEDRRNTYFSKLSGGQKQRVFIALALLPDPQLVFLDELTTGLDPQARHTIWDLVRGIRLRGKTVILTTHFMEEAEKLCDRIAILDHGKVVALDTPANLIRAMGVEECVVFSVTGPLPDGFENLFSGEVRLEVRGQQVAVRGKDGRSLPLVSQVVNQLASQGIQFHDLRTEQPNLEDVFLGLTGRELRE